MRLALALLAIACACGKPEPVQLGVGAATVLRHAMPELAAKFRDKTGTRVDAVYGASDTLHARAGLDVLVLADDVHLVQPTDVATTSMVLVGAAGAPHRFANLDADTVVAIGDPQTVPAGRYAREYLVELGRWDALAPRLVYGGDVLGVLALAQRGTSHVAIVYATDVGDVAPLVVLDRATGGPLVRIAAAPTAATARAGSAARFVAFLTSPDARTILSRHGFSTPGEVAR